MDLVLSNDLSVITAEIIAHKGMLAQNVFEIGARLKHVKENNLAHGQWERWCSEECGISPRNARRYIRIYERFANRTHVADLGGLRKMDMLAEFTDEELETPVQLPSGETKAPLQMNTSEIEQYKRAKAEAERRAQEAERLAKEAESRAAKAENEARHWEGVARSAQNRPPIIQKEVVPPPDYEQIKETANRLNTENVQLQRAMMEMRNNYEEQLTAEDHKREARRNLKKACETLLQDISTYTSTILFNYKLIQGDREAYQFLEAFGQQYNMRMQEFFGELKNLTQLRAIK